MRLKELKLTDFQNKERFDFIFPIGSTEQHGPYIPYGTDTYITNYLVNRVLNKYPDIILLPTLEVSRSREHRGFYGTLWLREETLGMVMCDICESIAERARNIFITSFHANQKYIEKFVNETNLGRAKLVYLPMSNEDDERKIEKIIGGPLDDHAGNTEIANMLVIDRELVKLPQSDDEKMVVDDPFGTDNLIEKCPTGVADNYPKWVIGDEMGENILDVYTERMFIEIDSCLKGGGGL